MSIQKIAQKLAQDISGDSTHGVFLLGAVLVSKRGDICACARNIPAGADLNTFYIRTHAEYRLLDSIPAQDRIDSTLFVARSSRGGLNKFCSAKPCNGCLNFAIKRGVKKIFYTEAGEWHKMYI